MGGSICLDVYFSNPEAIPRYPPCRVSGRLKSYGTDRQALGTAFHYIYIMGGTGKAQLARGCLRKYIITRATFGWPVPPIKESAWRDINYAAASGGRHDEAKQDG